MFEFSCECNFLNILLTVLGLLVGLYFWINRNLNYFEKKGIPQVKPWPFFGNIGPAVLGKSNFGETVDIAYKAFPNHKFVGYHQFMQPHILLRDLELIRKIAIKDFDHFTDHTEFVSEESDPLFGKSLLSLKGNKWRAMRATLSPAFTSSKIKGMYLLVSESAEQMANYLRNELKDGPKVYEMKDLFTRYTNDVIATAAFGIKVDSLLERENLFYQMVKKSTGKFMGIIFILKASIIASFPNIAKMLNLKLIPNVVSNFFKNLIVNTITIREEEGIIRPDLIQLLMRAKKGTLNDDEMKMDSKRFLELTDEDIVSQALIFVLAGFETSSTLMSFLSHELAVNPDIQKRLQSEIDAVKIKEKNVTFETLKVMKYMDMIISETLRKYPPIDGTNRKCVKPYTLIDDDQNVKISLNVGDPILIPIFSIHRDAQYYPNPEKFDPERFSEENKRNIHPLSYLPFGIGPRICIGSRFALMEIKLVLFSLLSNFSFEMCGKTEMPLQFRKDFSIGAKNGFWLELRLRK